MIRLLPTLLLPVIIVSCSLKKTCKYEADYNAVADTLKITMQNTSLPEGYDKQLFTDFKALSCSEYQEKYKLSDKDLLVSITAMRTSIMILDAFRSIEQNIQRATDDDFDQIIEKGDAAVEDLQDAAGQ